MKKSLKTYLLLWSTQALSALGSSMTSYALVLWLYLERGSALETALLSVCSYGPYVLMSVFAGALSDRWDKKKTMLGCDLLAAVSTVGVLLLARSGGLRPWHLYAINAFNGLMNSVQQPASEVAATLLVAREDYQKTSGLRSFSQALNTLLMPVLATALFAFGGLGSVIAFDLATFGVAFVVLAGFVRLPQPPQGEKKEPVLSAVRAGLRWLGGKPLVWKLILFLACINLVASVYDAALPALVLSRSFGGKEVLGLVNACVGAATLVGSVLVAVLPGPKDRVRAVCLALLLSMSTENFLLAFGRSPAVWCVGAALGWLAIPYMNANLDVIFRTEIPPEMQGRVFACRNTLQFFTIPVGFLLGGVLVDKVFEPFLAAQPAGSALAVLFGAEKGAGAALLFALLGAVGVGVCLVFRWALRKYQWSEKEN